jgi:hypothetical protein
MTAITPHIRVLRALAASFDGEAAQYDEAARRSAVPGGLAKMTAIAKLLSDGCQTAAAALETEEQALIDRFAGPQPKGH